MRTRKTPNRVRKHLIQCGNSNRNKNRKKNSLAELQIERLPIIVKSEYSNPTAMKFSPKHTVSEQWVELHGLSSITLKESISGKREYTGKKSMIKPPLKINKNYNKHHETNKNESSAIFPTNDLYTCTQSHHTGLLVK